MSTRITDRRHREWREHQLRWRWLLDSLEGGERYRTAVYGTDARGFPRRNLIRHKREYPAPGPGGDDGWDGWRGTDLAAAPTDDDYALRLVRTPPPDLVAQVVRKHLGRIYRHKVRREGPDAYLAWSEDVDESGLDLDAWMRQSVAPLLLAIGTVDVVMEHPEIPEGERVVSQADADRLNLAGVVARLVMPWDVLWWRLDRKKRYEEVLVQERVEAGGGAPTKQFRHWTKSTWATYTAGGKKIAEGEHDFGIVPQVRLKLAPRHTCDHVGLSILEAVAERQREYYNRDSELILSDVIQAHPLVQGPEDALAGGAMNIGPGWVLPKKKCQMGSSVSYEGFDVVDFPKGGAESIRANLDRLRDEVGESQALSKPAGASGSGPVEQSGVSKSFDHDDRNDLLGEIADALQADEVAMGRLACVVASDGKDAGDAVKVAYSRQFDLRTGAELAEALATFQEVLASSGRAPRAEARVLQLILREDLLPGLDDADYAPFDAEIEAAVGEAGEERKAGLMAQVQAAAGAAQDGEDDPGDKDEVDEDEI